MKLQKIDGNVLTLMLALAFFNFIFLGTEYQFDNMAALVTGPEQVVTAQGYVLGASVLGFLLYPAMASYRKIKEKLRQILVFAGALADVICIFVIWQHTSYRAIVTAGCLCFILMGMAGSAVHYWLAQRAEQERLARTVGISYAAGIFLQFLNNNLVKNDMVESVVLAVSAAIFSVLLLNVEAGEPEMEEIPGEAAPENAGRAGIWLILAVALITCIFSTLDAAVTLVHVAGRGDVGQWPRLLLAGSGLLAGILFDSREHRYVNLFMYCVTVLSVLCIVVLENGGSFRAGLAVFYLSAGFFVVFFTSSFMRLSARMKCPRLWAGLGRAVNNICAFGTGSLSLLLLKSGSPVVKDSILLGLLVLISILFFLYSGAIRPGERKKEAGEKKSAQRSEEERLRIFADSFSLTEREREVLKVLLVSDENVQDIAEELMISRAALYRHLTSLNEKTGTKSRIGLVQFYYRYDKEIRNEKERED